MSFPKYKNLHYRLFLTCLVVFFGLFPFLDLPFLIEGYNTPRIIVFALTGIVTTAILISGRENHFTLPKIFYFIALAYAILTGIYIIPAVNPGDALSEWLRLTSALCMIFLITNLIWSDSYFILTCRLSVVATLILSAFAIAQFLPLVFKYFDDGKPILITHSFASTLGNKNFLAESFILLLPLNISAFLLDRKIFRWFHMSAIILLLFFLLLIQSLSAWLALLSILMIAVFVLIVRKKIFSGIKPAAFILTLLIFAGSIFFLSRTVKFHDVTAKVKQVTEYIRHPELLKQSRLENNNSVFERILIWSNSMNMIADHPFGAGLCNWKIYNPDYGIGGTQFLDTGNSHFEHPHNEYLLIASETGMAGLLLFLALFIYPLLHLFRIIHVEQDTSRLITLVSIAAGMISFLVLSLFGYPRMTFFSLTIISIYFAIALYEIRSRVSNIPFSKAFLLVFLLVFSITVFAFTRRYVSEKNHYEVHQSQVNKNFPRMLRASIRATSWWYPVDHSTTPLEWYSGMASFNMGRIEEARKYYLFAKEKSPYHLRVLNDLATSCEKTGRTEEAISNYKESLRITPGFVEGILNLSAAYYNAGYRDSAYTTIMKADGLKMNSREKRTFDEYLQVISAKDTLN